MAGGKITEITQRVSERLRQFNQFDALRQLGELRRDELMELARKYGVSGRSTMRRDELVEAVRATLASLGPKGEQLGETVSRKLKSTPGVAPSAGAPGKAAGAAKPVVAAATSVVSAAARETVPTAAPVRPVTGGQRPTTGPTPAPELGADLSEPQELPPGYGDNRLTLMVRDPIAVFAYWDMDPARLTGIARDLKLPVLTLRVRTWAEKGGHAVERDTLDIAVNGAIGTYYVQLPEAGLMAQAELGFMTSAGDFRIVASSSPVRAPRAVGGTAIEGAAFEPPVAAGTVEIPFHAPLETFEPAVNAALEAGAADDAAHGFNDAAGATRVRWVFPAAFDASALAPGPGDGAQAGFGAWNGPSSVACPGTSHGDLLDPASVAGPAGEGPWLRVNTEVVLYGATQPGSSVTINGVPVSVRADGSFELHAHMGEGQREYVVESIAPGGGASRECVIPVVHKRFVNVSPRAFVAPARRAEFVPVSQPATPVVPTPATVDWSGERSHGPRGIPG
jgi:uncharacterized protein